MWAWQERILHTVKNQPFYTSGLTATTSFRAKLPLFSNPLTFLSLAPLLQVQETTTPVSRMVQTVHSEDADLLYMAGKNLQRGKLNHVHVGLALIIVHHPCKIDQQN